MREHKFKMYWIQYEQHLIQIDIIELEKLYGRNIITIDDLRKALTSTKMIFPLFGVDYLSLRIYFPELISETDLSNLLLDDGSIKFGLTFELLEQIKFCVNNNNNNNNDNNININNININNNNNNDRDNGNNNNIKLINLGQSQLLALKILLKGSSLFLFSFLFTFCFYFYVLNKHI